MERLSRISNYLRWPGTASNTHAEKEEDAYRRIQKEKEKDNRRVDAEDRVNQRLQEIVESHKRQQEMQANLGMQVLYNIYSIFRKLLFTLEGILLWEDTYWSITIFITFSVLYWLFVLFGIEDVTAACSANMVLVICYGTMECLVDESINNEQIKTRHERRDKLIKTIKFFFETGIKMQQEQLRLFLAHIGIASFFTFLLTTYVDSCFTTYFTCWAILHGPALILQCQCKEQRDINRDWDSAIEEFLPAATADNLQVLTRAGETGDRSPTPPSPDMDAPNDHLELDELQDLKMPSHEDGSTDGLELSELELSAGETDVDGVCYQRNFFERDYSTSDDEVDLELRTRKLGKNDNVSDGSDHDSDNIDHDSDDSMNSEFEIIDSQEIESLKMV